MPRRTRSTAAKENAAANNASSEQPPDPPKIPEGKADGNGKKTAANASLPQALKPFGDLSEGDIRKGIEERGEAFIQQYRDSVDDIEKWFMDHLGCRVQAQEVDGKLVVKLRKALRMVSDVFLRPHRRGPSTDVRRGLFLFCFNFNSPLTWKCNFFPPPSSFLQDGLGVGENGEDIAVTTEDVNNVKNAKNARIELAAYFTHLTTFPPLKGASAEVMAGEIIEYLETDGDERFFVNQDIESLNELHGELSGKSKPSKYKDLGRLVRALRKLKNYSHNNYQPTQQDVSMLRYQF